MNFNQEDLMILNKLDDIVLIENIKDIIKVKKKQLELEKDYQKVYDFLCTIPTDEICHLSILKEDKKITYSLPSSSFKIIIDFSGTNIKFIYNKYVYETNVDELINKLSLLHQVINEKLLDCQDYIIERVKTVPKACGTIKKRGDSEHFM